MDAPLALPGGFSARPCVLADAPAVYELVAASEAHDAGEVLIDLEDIESEWARPSFDLAGHTVAVIEDATRTLVGQGEMTMDTRADCCVHPAWCGKGIGTWLVGWTEDRARSLGASRVGQTVVDTATDAITLFERRGYTWLWTSWILGIDFADTPLEPPTLPEGYSIRDFVPGEDDRRVHEVIDTAFLEWSDANPSRSRTGGRRPSPARAANRGCSPWWSDLRERSKAPPTSSTQERGTRAGYRNSR